MNRLRSLAPAVVCLLVWLLFAGMAPAADASEGQTADAASNPFDVFTGERGKHGTSAALDGTRLTDEPVGYATGRGFSPFGTVAAAFEEADCGNYYECNPDWEEDNNGGSPDATPVPTPTPSPTPSPTPTPDPRIYEAIAYDRAHPEAVEWVNERTPSFNTGPPPRAQVVQLRSFFWIHESWDSKEFSSTENGIEVTITATPLNSVWRLEEQLTGRTHEYICDGPGHEYRGNPNEVSLCGHTFEHSSSVLGDVVLTAAVTYEFTVDSSLADHRSNFTDGQVVLPSAGTTIDLGDTQDAVSNGLEFPLWVDEVQTFGHRADAEIAGTDPVDTGPITPEEGRSCGIGEKIAYYGTVGIPLRVLGIDCGEAFEVLDLLKTGVVACAGGIARSIGEVATLLKNIVTDPVGTAKDGIAGLQALITMAQEDPGEFVATVGLGVLGIDKAEWDAAAGDNEERAKIAVAGLCAVALEIIAGSAAKKILDLIPGRPGSTTPDPDAPDTDVPDSDAPDTDAPNTDAPDSDSPDRPRLCPAAGSSFPTGTHVRMGSGELAAIEDIRPGDSVLASDPATGKWSNQLVLDQWSYLDTDQMTTAVLVDGSTITATDHHLFWVDSDHEWVELEHVATGDQLLTPNGVTLVAAVTTHAQTETLVWELDTAGPDTFTVNTGTSDLLVHNADSCPIGNWSDRQRQDIEAGTELGGLDPVPAHRLRNLLNEYRTRDIFDANGNRFIIDRNAMEAILSRHHPRYFDADGKKTRNTAFDGSATPDDIVAMMQDALRNGDPVPGKPNNFAVEIDGITYELAVDPVTGRVANHFAPQDPFK